jgi:hypothetical protein
MAKQSKAVIAKRKSELMGFGYTEQELARPDILEAIENTTAGNWQSVAEGLNEKHNEALPFTEAEVIEPAPIGEISVIGETMKKELKAFENNPLVAAIAEFEKKYKGLTFSGLEDKSGIEALKAAKKTVQKTRTFVTKHEDQLKAPYLGHLNDIRIVSKKYQAMIAPIEEPLDKELERLKAMETAEEERKAKEAEAEGTRRVELLKESGMKFDGQFYVIGETMSVDYSSIKAMTIEEFNKFTGKVQAEKKRLDELAEQELAQLKAVRLAQRRSLLLSIGMEIIEAGTEFLKATSAHLPGVAVLPECLTDESDDSFMKLVSSLSTRIAEAKAKADEEIKAKAKERMMNMRSKLIIASGMELVDWIPGTTKKGFYFKNEFTECKMPLPDLEAMTDDEFDQYIELLEPSIIEAKNKATQKEESEKKAKKLAHDRGQQLIELGMTMAPQLSSYVFNLPNAETKCAVAYGELTGHSSEKWEDTIKQVTEIIVIINREQKAFEDKAAKEKKDREDKEAADLITFQQRQYDLVNLGMVIVGNAFTLKNEFGDFASIAIDEVKAIDADTWPRRLSEVTTAVEAVKKSTEDKRNEALAQAEALKPKVQIALEFIQGLEDEIGCMPNTNDDAINKELTALSKDVLSAIVNTRVALESLKQ